MNALNLAGWCVGEIPLREALHTVIQMGRWYDVVVLHPDTFEDLVTILSDAEADPYVARRPDGDIVAYGTRFRRIRTVVS